MISVALCIIIAALLWKVNGLNKRIESLEKHTKDTTGA